MRKVLSNAIAGMVLAAGLVVTAWAAPDGQININSANAEELALMLVGVGESRAQAIIDYRQQHGDFTEVSDLLAVRGIGTKVIEDNAAKIVVSD